MSSSSEGRKSPFSPMSDSSACPDQYQRYWQEGACGLTRRRSSTMRTAPDLGPDITGSRWASWTLLGVRIRFMSWDLGVVRSMSPVAEPRSEIQS